MRLVEYVLSPKIPNNLTPSVNLILCGVVFGTDDNETSADDLAEQECIATLSQLNFEELVGMLNQLDENDASTGAIYIANALMNIAKDENEDVLIEGILNNGNSNFTKVTLIQICDELGYNVTENNEILSQMTDEQSDFEVKRNILINYTNHTPNPNLLEEIVYGPDERLGFHALKFLNLDFPERAIPIADTILSDYENYSKEKICSALKVKSQQFYTTNQYEGLSEYISICDEIFSGYNDKDVKDTVVFALADTMSEAAIKYIINNNKIETSFKGYCIEQNYRVLKELLVNAPTAVNIKLVTDAMDIFPINQMKPVLENIEVNVSETSSTNIANALEQIELHGENAVDKY